FGGQELGCVRFRAAGLAAIVQPGRLHCQQLRRVEAGRGPSQRMSYGLVLADGASEDHAIAGVASGDAERRATDAHRLDGRYDSLRVETVDKVVEAPADLTDHVLVGTLSPWMKSSLESTAARPSLSIRRTVHAVRSRSVKKRVIPSKGRASWRGEVRASRRIFSACWALVVQTFWPLTTQQSPVCSAQVVMRDVSEPAVGSVTPKASSSSPAAIPGRQPRFIRSEPKWTTGAGGNMKKWTGEAPLVPAPERQTACMTTAASVIPSPAPPYSSGMMVPSQPRLASARTNSQGYCSLRSCSSQYSGAKLLDSARTSSCRACWSSVSAKSIRPLG